jgi:hypothetical protein
MMEGSQTSPRRLKLREATSGKPLVRKNNRWPKLALGSEPALRRSVSCNQIHHPQVSESFRLRDA